MEQLIDVLTKGVKGKRILKYVKMKQKKEGIRMIK